MSRDITLWSQVDPTSPHREFFPIGHEADGPLLVTSLEISVEEDLTNNPATIAALPFFVVEAERERGMVLRYPADQLWTPSAFGIVSERGRPLPGGAGLRWDRRDAGDDLRWFLREAGRERPSLDGVGKVTLIVRSVLIEDGETP